MREMIKSGTTKWAIYHLKAIGLPQLICDLEKLERTGYPEQKCAALKEALREIIRLANQAAGSLWQPCMLSELQQFLTIYEKWNDRREGADLVDRMHRRQRIDEMRNVRKQIRKNFERLSAKFDQDPQPSITDSADGALANGIYGQLEKLTQKFPDTFPILSTAVKSYAAGSGAA